MKNIALILLSLFSVIAMATHNRAGEITYRQIDELTYEITLVTYTYTPSAANETRDYLPLSWGDNTEELIPRIAEIYLPDQYTKNIYKATHVYPGPGIYHIIMEDPNRNDGVNNIPGSVNVVFSVTTILKIDASVGFNTTPVLLNPPLDKAVVGQKFIHNPAAFDAEGDSLSYRLTVCRQENGEPIPGYTYPPSTDVFYVDSIIGDLVWDAPTQVGSYNVAMLIEEWRNEIKIGQILRDMQIEVQPGDNIKPEIQDLNNYCVEAGQNLNFTIEATDVDNDYLSFSYSGGPFELSPTAQCTEEASTNGYVKYKFDWNTSCDLVRRMPYQAVFKVTEQDNNPNLVDFESALITIVAPAPKDLVLSSTFNSIHLTWEPSVCTQAIAYDIYRKESPSGWEPSSCETGVPNYVGFTKIGHTDGYSAVNFTDNNNGMGLNQGYSYCYRVVALFEDGAESYASKEECTQLEIGYPLITKVSVDSTDNNKGKINLQWSKFTNFDTIASSGPYVYLIYRSEDYVGNNLTLIDSTLSKNDTSYTDKLLNTENQVYSYSIEMYNNSPGNRHLLGNPQLASSPFLKIASGDNKLYLTLSRNTPWVNDTMIIFRKGPSGTTFDSIAYTLDNSYIDSNLINDREYCYYIKTVGHYPPDELNYPIINLSQIACAEPTDTIAPCPPKLSVKSFCDLYYNQLKWTVEDSCLDDILFYNIYYSPTYDGQLELLHTTLSNKDSVFLHYPDLSIAGCYAVTAVDSFANETSLNQKVCVDNCTYYRLPNVFTPNGDNLNDLVVPGPYKFVQKVNMKIYNRWGNLVFQTENPDIEWDGRYMENGKLLSAGVYYYICDVYEYRLTGVEVRVLSGFIQLSDPKDIGRE